MASFKIMGEVGRGFRTSSVEGSSPPGRLTLLLSSTLISHLRSQFESHSRYGVPSKNIAPGCFTTRRNILGDKDERVCFNITHVKVY